MEVHKIVLYVVDHDRLGGRSVQQELENARYGNDCISPNVLSVESREIGEWDDAHPLNNSKTAAAEVERLFSTDTPAAAPITAEHQRTLIALLDCCEAWKPDVRILGNVRAEDAADAIRAVLSAPVAAQPAVSGVSALWVEEAEQLADNAINAHATWFAECALGELSNFHMPHLESEKDAAREALRAHLSTALTGAAKEVK